MSDNATPSPKCDKNIRPEDCTQSNCKTPKCKPAKARLRIPYIALWVLAALIVAAFFLLRPMLQGAPSAQRIKIPQGATLQNVEDTLHKYYPAKYADNVIRLLKARDVDFATRYGSYVITKGMLPFNAMRRLASGGETPVKLTFNNLRTPEDLAEVISQKTAFSRSSFLEALNNPEILAKYGIPPGDGMALMLEDTYEVYWSATPEEVIATIGKNYNRFWNEERREKAHQAGLSPSEMMTLASIVNEETNIADEKGHIGRLYLQRMAKGMRLQSDPTVKYAVGDFSIKRVNDKHLQTESPYNTYRVKGLPPTPIRTVDKTTLDAILNASPTEDIYMCAKEDFSGRHNFTSDYQEHMRNARRYQDELNRRNIH